MSEAIPPSYDPEAFARIKAALEESAFIRHCGLLLESLAKGRCEARLPLESVHANAYGLLHGGVVATLIDTVSGVAAWTLAEPDERVSTVELKVNFIGGVSTMEGELRASGEVLHRGRTTAVVEADVHGPEGRRIARGLGTFIYLARKREAAGG
ncbi:MAG: PaaI family thioesterase [Nitrospinota bacterium]